MGRYLTKFTTWYLRVEVLLSVTRKNNNAKRGVPPSISTLPEAACFVHIIQRAAARDQCSSAVGALQTPQESVHVHGAASNQLGT